MKIILFLFFAMLVKMGLAQTFPKKYVDSLTTVALSFKTTHPLVLNRDSALQVLWKQKDPAIRIAMFYDITDYSDELSPDSLLYYHQLILAGAKKRNDKVLEASVLAELGYIISKNGNTAGGLKMIYESLEKAEATGNAQAIGIAYNNLGNCYPNNPTLTKEYMTKSLEYGRKGNDFLFVAFDLGNLSHMYSGDNMPDSALSYALAAYALAVDKKLEEAQPAGILKLSELDPDPNKLEYYRKAARMAFSIRNLGMKNDINSAIANYYLQNKRMDSAFYFAVQYNNYAKTANSTAQLSALSLMGNYYRALPNADSALSYLERFVALKDSLFGDKVMEQSQSMAYNDMQRQKELEAQHAAFQNKLILYIVSAAALFLLVLTYIFWRTKRKEEQAKKIVQYQKNELEATVDKLKSTQSQLIQAEKMASLGELTAGIAHEIQNPLNFVNNFSEVNQEMIEELQTELKSGNTEEAIAIANDIKANEEKINHHGKRADAIVKGMLQHSRSSTGTKEPTDINVLADEYLRLAYHGLRAKDKSFNATLKTDFDNSIGKIDIIPQDMGRVILNLITNAFYAVDEKKKQMGNDYEPIVTVSTNRSISLGEGRDEVLIKVADNGSGIPASIKDKIFQPFFTTKPTGQGTGLGLSLAYDIVKAHGGEIKAETQVGDPASSGKTSGTTFIIHLPQNSK